MFKRAAAAFAFAAISLLASAMPAPGSSTFHFGAASYNTKEGNGTVTISVIREGNLGNPAYTTLTTGCCSDTAGYGQDYWFTAGFTYSPYLSVSFAPNETSKDVSISINDDSLAEGTEVATLTFYCCVNTSFPDRTTLVIADNEPVSSIAMEATQYSIAENDGGSVTIGVVRTGDLSVAASVPFSTSNGTATAGSDYQTVSGTLTFAANESRKTFSIPIINDTIAEGNEYFYAQLGTPTGATLGSPSYASVIIVDDVITHSGNHAPQADLHSGDNTGAEYYCTIFAVAPRT